MHEGGADRAISHLMDRYLNDEITEAEYRLELKAMGVGAGIGAVGAAAILAAPEVYVVVMEFCGLRSAACEAGIEIAGGIIMGDAAGGGPLTSGAGAAGRTSAEIAEEVAEQLAAKYGDDAARAADDIVENADGLAARTAQDVGANGSGFAGELTSITQTQLDKKFKHASDFGVVTTKKNPETLAQFESAVKAHMSSTSTVQQGTYGLVKDSKVFFNTTTNNVVVVDGAGNFVTGFKLYPGTPQFENFIKNGVLR